MRQWIIAAVACAGLAGGGWYYFQDDGCDEQEAYRVFQVAMAQHLRAPSTAIYQPWDQVATEGGLSCTFGLTGYVESQNGFGAMTKSEFSGEVIKTVRGDFFAAVYLINGRLPGL